MQFLKGSADEKKQKEGRKAIGHDGGRWRKP
jgi:hypothetical protein